MTTPEPEEEMEETIVVTMVDEEGSEEEFALLDMIEVDGRRYGLFAPVAELEAEDDDDDEDEVSEAEEEMTDEDEDGEGILVLRSVQRGSEQDFEIIEDEEEFNKVLNHLEKVATATQLHFGTSVNNN